MKTRNSGSAAHIVILCLCWYLISSLGSQVTKSILTIYPKPLFLGEFQFIYTVFLAAICCFIAHRCRTFYRWFPRGTFPLYYEDETREKRQIKTLTRPTKHILLTVLPLSFFQFVGKYFGHTATSLVPVSTVASIKTLSPVFILIFQRLLNVQRTNMSGLIYFSLACLIMGFGLLLVRTMLKERTTPKIADKPHWAVHLWCAVCSIFDAHIRRTKYLWEERVHP